MHANPQTWREFFDRHAPFYEQNPFTQNSKVEVQFLIEAMGLKPGMSLLDAGCGTGRHAVLLQEAGLKVTGVDFSAGMLEVARAKGSEAEFVEADLTKWSNPGAYEAAVCLCEGGFGLINKDEDGVAHDLAILRNISASLKPGAPFLMTALNGYAVIRRVTDAHVENGAFDPVHMNLYHLDEMKLPEGDVQMMVKERLFIPTEVVAMLRTVGLQPMSVWGGTAGEWGQRPLKMDEIEAMYLARKA